MHISLLPRVQWLLLRPINEDMATLVHLLTGVIESFTLLTVALETSMVRGWEAHSTLSPDGQWLFLKPLSSDVATLVHLPSGASESFALPAAAVVVGWR